MIQIGPRVFEFIDDNERDVTVKAWFNIDIETPDQEGYDIKSSSVTISSRQGDDVVYVYAQDQLQACHRLMMMTSAYLAQMAETEKLRPRLGTLPAATEGFALFQY